MPGGSRQPVRRTRTGRSVRQRESKIRWRFYIFFTPITATTTAVHSIVYGRSTWPGPTNSLSWAKYVLGHFMDREMKADVAMLGHLADDSRGPTA